MGVSTPYMPSVHEKLLLADNEHGMPDCRLRSSHH